MARLPELQIFAKEHGLKLVSIEQLAEYRRRTEAMVTRVVETRLPNRYGAWKAVGFSSAIDGGEHIALVLGDVGDGEDVLIRAHSECLTGDVLHSERCDCGTQLDAAMERIAEEGRGIVLYLRGHEDAASACSPSCRPTRSRTTAPTPWTPTWSSGSPPTRASTPTPRTCSVSWAYARCGCSPTTRRS